MPVYTKSVAATAPAYQPEGQEKATAWNRATFATGEMTLNASYAMVRLPRGAVIQDITLIVSDMDSGAAGLVGVGVAGDVARYIQGASIQAAGSFRMGNNATSVGTILAAAAALTAETEILVTFTTAPGTAIAGTIQLSVDYTCE